jgi:hypothetical protein
VAVAMTSTMHNSASSVFHGPRVNRLAVDELPLNELDRRVIICSKS